MIRYRLTGRHRRGHSCDVSDAAGVYSHRDDLLDYARDMDMGVYTAPSGDIELRTAPDADGFIDLSETWTVMPAAERDLRDFLSMIQRYARNAGPRPVQKDDALRAIVELCDKALAP